MLVNASFLHTKQQWKMSYTKVHQSQISNITRNVFLLFYFFYLTQSVLQFRIAIFILIST